MTNQKTRVLPIDSLSIRQEFYEYFTPQKSDNPSYELLKYSIEQSGIQDAIKIGDYENTGELVIIDGHTRYTIAKELGLTEVPTLLDSDCVTSEQFKEQISIYQIGRRNQSAKQLRHEAGVTYNRMKGRVGKNGKNSVNAAKAVAALLDMSEASVKRAGKTVDLKNNISNITGVEVSKLIDLATNEIKVLNDEVVLLSPAEAKIRVEQVIEPGKDTLIRLLDYSGNDLYQLGCVSDNAYDKAAKISKSIVGGKSLDQKLIDQILNKFKTRHGNGAALKLILKLSEVCPVLDNYESKSGFERLENESDAEWVCRLTRQEAWMVESTLGDANNDTAALNLLKACAAGDSDLIDRLVTKLRVNLMRSPDYQSFDIDKFLDKVVQIKTKSKAKAKVEEESQASRDLKIIVNQLKREFIRLQNFGYTADELRKEFTEAMM